MKPPIITKKTDIRLNGPPFVAVLSFFPRIIDYIEMYCVISDNRAISVVILPVDVKSLATDQLEYYIVGR